MKVRKPLGLWLPALVGLLLGAILGIGSTLLVPSTRASWSPPPQRPEGLPAQQAAATAAAADVVAEPGEADASGLPAPTALPGAVRPEAQVTATPAGSPAGSVSVLVMGTDNRPNEPPVGRTDTIMLVTVNPELRSVGMISMARDLLVPIHGMTQTAKINTAHVYGESQRYPGGGPALLRDTLADFLGYRADYWVRVNFEGFREIIDQIGGIDIVVPKAIDDPLYPDNNYGYDPLYIPAGRIHMDGALALKFARTRHVDSDYGRARRQQQVVMAVKNKLMQPGNLTSLLPRVPGLAMTLAKSVQTDMPINKIIEYARTLGQVDFTNQQSLVIDDTLGSNASDPVWGFVLVPNTARVRAATARVFKGESPQPELARKTLDPAIVSEGARIAVLNGTSQIRLAETVATNLAAEGYRIAGIGKAGDQNYAKSWLIAYGNIAPATRDALARKYAIAPDRIRVEQANADADLALVLGTDLAQREAMAR